MGVHIQEVVANVQRAPERTAAPKPGAGRKAEAPSPAFEEDVRAVLEREAMLAARVRAD